MNPALDRNEGSEHSQQQLSQPLLGPSVGLSSQHRQRQLAFRHDDDSAESAGLDAHSHPSGTAAASAGEPSAEEDPAPPHHPHRSLLRSLSKALAEADAEHSRVAWTQMLGLALYALSTVFGSVMSLMAKLAGAHGISIFEVVLVRSLFLVAFTGPELVWRRSNPFGDPGRRWLYLLRGVLGYLSVSSLYLAVRLLPMGDAAVLSFLSPVFVASLAPCVLRETPSKGVLLAIPFCMAGVMLVSKPSFVFGQGAAGAISMVGVTVGIMQAVFNAASRISVRALSIGSNEPMAGILFSMGAVSAVCAAGTLGALREFVVPRGLWVYVILASNGISGYLYQVALTAGLQRADAAPAVAMSYLGVIWGVLFDVFIFSTPPTPLSVAGALVISVSSFLVAYGEKRRQQKARARRHFEASQQRLDRVPEWSSAPPSKQSSQPDLVLLLPPPEVAEDEAPGTGRGSQSQGEEGWSRNSGGEKCGMRG